jgi:hypothetical protein
MLCTCYFYFGVSPTSALITDMNYALEVILDVIRPVPPCHRFSYVMLSVELHIQGVDTKTSCTASVVMRLSEENTDGSSRVILIQDKLLPIPLRIMVFCVVTPCSLVRSSRRFRGPCRLEVKAIRSSEMSHLRWPRSSFFLSPCENNLKVL